mmetsp:Transcript_26270/g.54145  ORF Transcript_26270/g.54145 Transcript_26270/m.54145 type:complete len:160 (+) Transcript_26270:584-1063(+)
MVQPTSHWCSCCFLYMQALEGLSSAVPFAFVAWKSRKFEGALRKLKSLCLCMFEKLPPPLLTLQQSEYNDPVGSQRFGCPVQKMGQQASMQLQILCTKMWMVPSHDVPVPVPAFELQGVHSKSHFRCFSECSNPRQNANCFRVLVYKLGIALVAGCSEP